MLVILKSVPNQNTERLMVWRRMRKGGIFCDKIYNPCHTFILFIIDMQYIYCI